MRKGLFIAKKKFVALLSVAVLSVGMTGCGKSDDKVVDDKAARLEAQQEQSNNSSDKGGLGIFSKNDDKKATEEVTEADVTTEEVVDIDIDDIDIDDIDIDDIEIDDIDVTTEDDSNIDIDIDVDDNDKTTPNISANSSLSAETESVLATLQSDYSKVNWGVKYSPIPDMPHIVVSVAPFVENGDYRLLVAVTNLYDTNAAISAEVTALSSTGESIGDAFIYTDAIGTGNTVLAVINCGDKMPDGRLHWEDINVDTDTSKSFVPWDAKYSAKGDQSSGRCEIEYSISSATGESFTPDTVTFLLLDSNGNILGIANDYVSDTIDGSSKYENTISTYVDTSIYSSISEMAMFAESRNQ